MIIQYFPFFTRLKPHKNESLRNEALLHIIIKLWEGNIRFPISEISSSMTGSIIELMNRTESKDIVTCYMCSKGCWTPDWWCSANCNSSQISVAKMYKNVHQHHLCRCWMLQLTYWHEYLIVGQVSNIRWLAKSSFIFRIYHTAEQQIVSEQ